MGVKPIQIDIIESSKTVCSPYLDVDLYHRIGGTMKRGRELMSVLYPHQCHALQHIWEFKLKNNLLCDPMGVGKTATAIYAHEFIYRNNLNIIFCPAILTENWRREIKKWTNAKDEEILIYTSQSAKKISPSTLPENIRWAVISYGLTSSIETMKLLNDQIIFSKNCGLIFDEAHYLKNIKAVRTKVCFRLSRNQNVFSNITCITGTPMPNAATELLPLLKILNFPFVNKYKTVKAFGKDWANTHLQYIKTKFGVKTKEVFAGVKQPHLLSAYLRESGMIRRDRTLVLATLPSLRENIVYFDAAPKIKKLLETERRVIETNLRSEDLLEKIKSLDNSKHMSSIRQKISLLKIPYLIEYFENQLENREKIVIFAHHREVIKQLHDNLKFYNPVVITGETSIPDRNRFIDRFQTDATCRVFIGSINATGIGITLTASSYCAFAEMSFVPTDNDQAKFRIHRIGQNKSCEVEYLVYENTFDEVIAQICQKKSLASHSVLDHN